MANAKLGTKAVGSIVKLKVGGTAKEFIVAHQGKPSSMYDSSCDGTWLLMKDCYEKHVWHSSNINKYETSDINTYLNGPFFNLFDSNIQGIIKQVKIPYRKNGGKWGTDQSGANGLPAKIFLLAGYEVGWTTSDGSYFPVDGAKLDYFAASSGGNSKRIANFNGSATSWWLRSPYTDGADRVWDVNSQGRYGGGYASDSLGIRPALVLPPDMEVDSSGNVTPPPPPATHKTLVNGTVYEVKGGKCLVNGTVYSIKKGRTLIAGTGYDITFEEPASKSWYLNEGLSGTVDATVIFKSSDGTSYVRIKYGFNGNLGFYTLQYFSTASETDPLWVYAQNNGQNRWRDTAKRTITFDEPPAGDLLAWLEQNATPQ